MQPHLLFLTNAKVDFMRSRIKKQESQRVADTDIFDIYHELLRW